MHYNCIERVNVVTNLSKMEGTRSARVNMFTDYKAKCVRKIFGHFKIETVLEPVAWSKKFILMITPT